MRTNELKGDFNPKIYNFYINIILLSRLFYEYFFKLLKCKKMLSTKERKKCYLFRIFFGFASEIEKFHGCLNLTHTGTIVAGNDAHMHFNDKEVV